MSSGELTRTVETLFSPDDVVELRTFKNGAPSSGFFDDPEKLVEAAVKYDRKGYEVYVTLNRLRRELLHRRTNTAERAKRGEGTADGDVERRLWVFIDADPERVSGISATDAEKEQSRLRVLEIQAFLAERGWGRGILCDSGNGYHLLYPIDLPNDDESRGLVGGVLEALHAKFTDEVVKVDRTTKNAARITKLYGVVAKKGEDHPDRPHRPSRILEVPKDLSPVSPELLSEIAALKPQGAVSHNGSHSSVGPSQSIEWVRKFIDKHDIPIGKHGPWNGDGYSWEIDEPCIWNGHTDTSFWMGVKSTGQIVGGCHHDSCTEYFWDDIREHYEPGSKERKAKPEGNQAQRLVGYAMEDVSELFLDQNGAEHALAAGCPIQLDRRCYGWLRRLFWEHDAAVASTDLLGTVAGLLRAFAEVSGNEHHLHLRAAQYADAVYLYLGPGRTVRVDAEGWELDPNPPVMFRRVTNLKELPNPDRGGSLDLLDDFITAREDRDHRLAKTWLALALLADVPRPLLLAHGPQGSTKSSVQRVLKNIIDPAKPTTLKLREKDFEQNINKSFIPFFDNVSTITDSMADELSKAGTGAGNAVRKLYEDDEDVIREYKRAMLLNGLIIPTEKADLIDRLLPVALKRVPKIDRETERRMDALFDERHPKLLGAVLDGLAGALSYHEEVRGLPRMADWGEYAIAFYKHLGWGGYDGFTTDWGIIEEGQHETTLEASALAQCVVAAVKEHGVVEDTPKSVLKLLRDTAYSEDIDADSKNNDFPASASWLWRKLVPVIPTLEAFHISVTEGTQGRDSSKKRLIRIARFDTPGGDSITPAGDSKENMLTPEKADTYGMGTAGTAGTAYFPENSRYPTNAVENRGSVLQDGKNAVPADLADPKAYLSGKSGDSSEGNAVPANDSADPESLDDDTGEV
jgi:hypothetical protein